MHRGRYLAMYGKTESNKHFLQYVDKIEIDEEKIEAKVRIPPPSGPTLLWWLTVGACLQVAAEKEKERQRPDAREYK